jgi:glycosyltransferase involved in cell wall biosynthesis
VSEQRAAMGKTLTIVVPVFNEAANVSALVERVERSLAGIDESWSILFVDDGSSDGTVGQLRNLAQTNCRVEAIALSRNFGKEAAMAAGLRHAHGDAVVLMDADLQHPPEVIPQFLEAWRGGSEVVHGLRRGRVGESLPRSRLSKFFYRLFARVSDLRIPKGATDFVLLDRKAVDAMNTLGERTRFTKGLISWIGFRTSFVPFSVEMRNEGETRWGLIELGNYAIDAFSSFSSLPLKVWSYIGVAVSAGAISYAIYFAIQTMVLGIDVPGFPSLIVSITFFAGVQLISLGVLGEYVARLFEEAKQRPLYLVTERIRQDEPGTSSAETSPM